MRRAILPRTPVAAWLALAGFALGVLTPRGAAATPDEFIPVGDPIEAELRVLDLLARDSTGARFRLPHLGTRPLQWLELESNGDDRMPEGAARIAAIRLSRALARNATPERGGVIAASTPRLFQRDWPAGERVELSTGLEGSLAAEDDRGRLVSGSGLHLRAAVGVDHWLAFSHLVVGRFDDARSFADPIVANTDFITHTEDTYLAYTGRPWSARLGRSRWHWGPGEEGSMVLSKTSVPMTGFATHARLEPFHLDFAALSATLDQAAGEQLAAHRLEWQPGDGLRLGATEAARYHAAGWEALYLVGVLPYVLVQRLQVQDEPDSLRALRNNVMVGLDAAWRVAPGTRLYGELLIDDLHAKSAAIPNKLGYQLGWEGVGLISRTRVTWGGEYTRLTRYVYTSFFGRAFEAQGRSIGFPTGPDVRRARVRVAWDPNADWQLSARASHTEKGENGLDEPFVPGSPRVDSSTLEGVVERARDLDASVRWWPASGVDLTVTGGYRWVENAAHLAGRSDDGARGLLEVRLTR